MFRAKAVENRRWTSRICVVEALARAGRGLFPYRFFAIVRGMKRQGTCSGILCTVAVAACGLSPLAAAPRLARPLAAPSGFALCAQAT
jgi:hypothetical protein